MLIGNHSNTGCFTLDHLLAQLLYAHIQLKPDVR